MSRNSCKGCEYSQKCELVKMTKEERKTEEIEEEIKKYIGGNNMSNIKVTQDQVDGFIKSTEVMTIREKTTLVHATLQNGFTITKTSACVDPENYDEKIGSEICLEHIKNEVWYLLGFLLQQREYERKQIQKGAN